jgi:hypothetical protein
MPRSKHHKKNKSASKWRKLSNIRRALRGYMEATDGEIPDWFIENHLGTKGKLKGKIVVKDKSKKSKYRAVKNV